MALMMALAALLAALVMSPVATADDEWVARDAEKLCQEVSEMQDLPFDQWFEYEMELLVDPVQWLWDWGTTEYPEKAVALADSSVCPVEMDLLHDQQQAYNQYREEMIDIGAIPQYPRARSWR